MASSFSPDATARQPADKILELSALGAAVERLRAQGKRIVHAHGVFDLLHVGHIRHLTEAKSLGDVLVVTLTEDVHVNKGPHRPAFAEALRAEAMAALESVDYVAINRSPNAVTAIDAIKPDVYVKGPDYKRAEDDVSGGIGVEEAAVRSHGGTLAITDDLTFSSSALINRYLPSYTPHVQEYLAALRSKFSSRDVAGYLDRLRTMKVVVVGEAILDEYVYCDQMGKSAKDPVLAMRYVRTELHAGGAMAVANHLASFCDSVELVTYLGENDHHEKFIRSSLAPNVHANFVYKAGSPTILKRRYLEQTLLSKLFEVYVINDDDLQAEEEERLCALLSKRVKGADLVVACDFGHGLLTAASRRLLQESGTFLAVNTQINASNIRYHAISSYGRADYVCINEGELRLDARNRYASVETLVAELSQRMACKRFLVTRGKQGVTYVENGDTVVSPSFALNVVDRTGSGDAVLALTSACVVAEVPAEVVAFVANVIGAQAVQVIGNRTAIDRVATYKFIDALLK